MKNELSAYELAFLEDKYGSTEIDKILKSKAYEEEFCLWADTMDMDMLDIEDDEENIFEGGMHDDYNGLPF